MTDPLELPAGTTIAEKYRVTRTLGKGGMGHVFEAEHLALGVKVAVKVLRKESDDDGSVGRFWREARAAALLESEYLARVHDYGSLPDGRPFMVMEHLDGEDLKQALSKGQMAIREAVDIACQTCAGLAHAHAAGIVHRDLKPSNLFLVKRGRHRRIKVLDFGISKLLKGDAHVLAVVETRTEALLGTPFYMAPEQVRCAKDVDPRADLWSLGVLLYEALAGGKPFDDASLGGLFASILEREPPRVELRRPEVPTALADIVHRCLDKDPTKRPHDAAALATLLEPFASDEGVVAVRRARDALDVVIASSGRGFVETQLAPSKDSSPPVGAPSSETPVSARSAPSQGGAERIDLPLHTIPESARPPGESSSRAQVPRLRSPASTGPAEEATASSLASGARRKGAEEGSSRAPSTWLAALAAVSAGLAVVFGATLWWSSTRPSSPAAEAQARDATGSGAPTGLAGATAEPGAPPGGSPRSSGEPVVGPRASAAPAAPPSSSAGPAEGTSHAVAPRPPSPRPPPAPAPPPPASGSAPKRPTLR